MKMTAYYALGLVGYELTVDDRGEKVFWRYTGESEPIRVRQSKIRYTMNGRPYFMAFGRRVHLDECVRTDIF